MVHKILKTFLPAISMAFMIIILLAGFINQILYDNQNGFISFIFEVFVYLIITCIIDELIGRIDFKSYIGHFLSESILIYPITIFFSVIFGWFAMNVVNLILYSVIYLCIMIGIHLYFYYIEKMNVTEINRLLEEGRRKNG